MIKSYDFVGGRISPSTIEELHAEIAKGIESAQKRIVVSQNFHSLYLVNKNASIRGLQKRSIVRIDGMPIVWLARLIKIAANASHRITWMDWKDRFFPFCETNDYKIFYLGSKEDVFNKALTVIRGKYPNLNINGHHGYFDKDPNSTENKRVLSLIGNNYDILIVGMGMPLQEEWVLEHETKIDTPIILTCGAAMEYIAGDVSVPPRWMGRFGLEWLFRLAEKPGRFWYRYLVEGWVVLFHFIKFALSKK